MSTGTPATPAPRRRAPRRAVRPPGTVGTDESVLRSTLPAPAAGATTTGGPDAGAPAGASVAEPSGPVRAARTPTEGGDAPDPWRATRAADDTDRGWGREEPSTNDDRLRRERPPHW